MVKVRGVALIQVLLIVALLSIFSLYVKKLAIEQVDIAQKSQSKALAIVQSHSVLSELLFTLLTEDIATPSNLTEIQDNYILSKLNFFGVPFGISNSIIKIQDQSGLLNIHYFYKSHFVNLFTENGVEKTRAEELWAYIVDWQDKDDISSIAGIEKSTNAMPIRNAKIADITELESIVELTEIEKELFYKNFSLFSLGELNLMAATPDVLSAIMGKELANSIVELRANNNLTVGSFRELTGITFEESYRFTTSSRLGFEIETKINDVIYKRLLILSVSPYAKEQSLPINILLDRK